MNNLFSENQLLRFFNETYKILGCANNDIIEVWHKISDFNSLEEIPISQREEFLLNFNFIKREEWDYVSIDKLLFIIESFKYVDKGIRNLSVLLDCNGFEALIKLILDMNNYYVLKNFRFSDRSTFQKETKQKKYEIDVIGIYRKYILVIDAKHWKKKDSYSAMSKAANLQHQRVIALQKNPDVFSKLISQTLGAKCNIKKHLPFTLIPLMVTLEDNSHKLNENQVPLVSISQFNAFLQEYENHLDFYKTEKIKKVSIQKLIL